eukprot:104205_1
MRVNCEFSCTNEDNKKLDYTIFRASSIQKQQTSKPWYLLSASKVNTATVLKVFCTIQETMTKKNDEFIWKIDGDMMKIFKDMPVDHKILSPYFPAPGDNHNNFFIICCKKPTHFEGAIKFMTRNEHSRQAIAANIRIEIPEIGAVLKDSRVLYNKSFTRTFRWFETDLMKDLNVITFKCKITLAAKTANVSGDPVKASWKINNALFKEFESAENDQTFLTCTKTIDDAVWCLEIIPKHKIKDVDVTYVQLRCTTPELYAFNSLIYYTIRCKEAPTNSFSNVVRADQLSGFVMRKKLCEWATINKLNEMTFEVTIQSNRKIWKMSMNQLIYNEYQFQMHRMKWKLETTNKYLTFSLIEMPPFIQETLASIMIESKTLKLQIPKLTCQYRFNSKDNWTHEIPLGTIDSDDEEKKENDEEIIILCDILVFPNNKLNDIEIESSKNLPFDPIIASPQNVDIKSKIKEDNTIYKKHNDIIHKWNENSTKLKDILIINDDEKKENDLLGTNLFEKYSQCIRIINQQSTRLQQVTTNDHLLQLLNHQNSLSNSIKQKESKQSAGLQQYNVQNKEYNTLTQQRIYLQNKIKREFKECNGMIQRENDLFQQLQDTLNKNKCVEADIETLKSSSASCVSVIKLYNEFMEQNKKYIDKINATFDNLWTKFESKWM